MNRWPDMEPIRNKREPEEIFDCWVDDDICYEDGFPCAECKSRTYPAVRVGCWGYLRGKYFKGMLCEFIPQGGIM